MAARTQARCPLLPGMPAAHHSRPGSQPGEPREETVMTTELVVVDEIVKADQAEKAPQRFAL